MKRKSVLIVDANKDGFEAAEELFKLGANVIMACADENICKTAKGKKNYICYSVDLKRLRLSFILFCV